MNLRKIINEERRRRGWSQLELSRQSGVRQQTVSKYLSGTGDTFAESAAAMMEALGLRVVNGEASKVSR